MLQHYHGAMKIWMVVFALPFLAVGCSGGPTTPAENLVFPPGFYFGTATAGFQVEMGCPTIAAAECEDRNSDWYAYVTTPALVGDSSLFIAGDPPSSGPGFYELYPADLDREKNELKGNSLRLSIEWSRIFPTSTIGVEDPAQLAALANPKGVAFYHALFAAMKARGLHPLVTINHYVLPIWIEDPVHCHPDLDSPACAAKGWVDNATTDHEIAKYAGFLGREFGGEVDDWATLNEPFTAVILPAYLFQTAQRTNPPADTLQYAAAKTAMLGEIVGHAMIYDAIKANDTVDADGDGQNSRVGIVYNLQYVVPSDPTNPQDVTGAKNADYLINQVFLNAVSSGDLDANLDGTVVHRDDLAQRMDFIGVNYYARLLVQGTPSSVFPELSTLLTFNPISLGYDYSYPQGIYEVLTLAHKWKVPLLVSETGSGSSGDVAGTQADWVGATLLWVKRAMNDGIPVLGYYYWTLMDNYEWNHGMQLKFGLYAVDPMDPQKTRTARAGVAAYAAIAQSGAIPAEVAAKFPRN
jgi:beta-glucosidase/6-phospho-beta-glucosidase/beta-galactosidase